MNANRKLAAARAGLTTHERQTDRKRAEKALGRSLCPPEILHHHSRKQLVICPNPTYHRLLHTIEDYGSYEAMKAATTESLVQLVQLRLPQSIMTRIDAARLRRIVPPSRHFWMLEAILEKLAKEESTTTS